MNLHIFFQSWSELLRVVIIGVLAYVALVTLLRLLGNRTLAKMNAYDLVVTFALGSTLAATILSQDVSLAEGITAFALLMTMEVLITWLSEHSSTFRELIESEPTLLFFRGRFLRAQMHRARVSKDDVREAVRKNGFDSVDEVEAVVLEPDGSFSVIRHSDETPTALDDLPQKTGVDG